MLTKSGFVCKISINLNAVTLIEFRMARSNYIQFVMALFKLKMLNLYFISFFTCLSQSAELNITDLVIGKWFIRYYQHTGHEMDRLDPRIFKLRVEVVDDYFVGNIISNEKPQTFSFNKIILNKTIFSNQDGKNEYRISASYSTDSSDEYKQLFEPLPIKEDVDDLVQLFGLLDSQKSFSFNYLSRGYAEVTIYDRTHNTIEYLTFQQDYPSKDGKKMMLHVLLPLVPVFIMMYNQSKAKNEEIRNHQASQRKNTPRTNKKD